MEAQISTYEEWESEFLQDLANDACKREYLFVILNKVWQMQITADPKPFIVELLTN